MASIFTLQVFDTARQFLDSQPASLDTAEMNIIIGSARDSLSRPQAMTIWLVVSGPDVATGGGAADSVAASPSRESSTTLMIVGSSTMETYYFSKPSDTSLSNELVDQIIDSIVTTLMEKPVPQIHSVWGPKSLIDPFLAQWSTRQQPPLQIRSTPNIIGTLAVARGVPDILRQNERKSTARSRLPITLSAVDLVTLAANSANATNEQETPEMERIKPELVECFVDFLGGVSEETQETARGWIEAVLRSKETGRLWIAKADKPHEVDEAYGAHGVNDALPSSPPNRSSNIVLGYLFVGRETDWTISIRNVYTRPSFRGYGVAAELVAASTKWWLEQEGDHKRKKEMTLFVNPGNIAAVKVYTKCGYQLGEEIWERRGFEGVSLGNF